MTVAPYRAPLSILPRPSEGNHDREPRDLGVSPGFLPFGPLLPTQLKRMARRVATALGRLGDPGGNDSGDLYLAFSTTNTAVVRQEGVVDLEYLPNAELSPLFLAT